jgi:hypothetical protein
LLLEQYFMGVYVHRLRESCRCLVRFSCAASSPRMSIHVLPLQINALRSTIRTGPRYSTPNNIATQAPSSHLPAWNLSSLFFKHESNLVLLESGSRWFKLHTIPLFSPCGYGQIKVSCLCLPRHTGTLVRIFNPGNLLAHKVHHRWWSYVFQDKSDTWTFDYARSTILFIHQYPFLNYLSSLNVIVFITCCWASRFSNASTQVGIRMDRCIWMHSYYEIFPM